MFKIFRVTDSDSNTERVGYKQHLGITESSTSKVFCKGDPFTLSFCQLNTTAA